MARGKRHKEAKAFYHVFNRGVEKRNIYLSDDDRQSFIRILRYVHKKYNFKIHAYCLMGNHYHLVLETVDEDISKIMHGIDGIYAHIINQKYERVGPLFQSRFKSIIVKGDYYLLNLFSYIHLNPVKDGFVSDAGDWYWSSFTSYIGNRCSEEFLETGLYQMKLRQLGIEDIDQYIKDQSKLQWCDLDDLEHIDYISADELFQDQELIRRKNYYGFDFDKALSDFSKRKDLDKNVERNFRIYVLNKIANIRADELAGAMIDLKANSIMRIAQRMANKIRTSRKYKEMFMDFMKKCPVCPRPQVDRLSKNPILNIIKSSKRNDT